jgi:purine nucleoside phosphorylase
MDCVGMSTAHEAIVASYCGLKVLAFSIITDKVCLEYDVEECPDHHEIVKVANEKAKDAEKLIELFLSKINDDKSILS